MVCNSCTYRTVRITGLLWGCDYGAVHCVRISEDNTVRHLSYIYFQRRPDETERIIWENPGIRAYGLSGMMSWRIRARS